MRSLVESTKVFVRWMDGTCIETAEQKGKNDEDEPVLFTFYWDVAANPQVGSGWLCVCPYVCVLAMLVGAHTHCPVHDCDLNCALTQFEAHAGHASSSGQSSQTLCVSVQMCVIIHRSSSPCCS